MIDMKVDRKSLLCLRSFYSSIGVGRARASQLLPPLNRTCGSRAYGSPVGGLTALRIDVPFHELQLSNPVFVGRGKGWIFSGR